MALPCGHASREFWRMARRPVAKVHFEPEAIVRQLAITCVPEALRRMLTSGRHHLVIEQIIAVSACVERIERKGERRVRERANTRLHDNRHAVI